MKKIKLYLNKRKRNKVQIVIKTKNKHTLTYFNAYL